MRFKWNICNRKVGSSWIIYIIEPFALCHNAQEEYYVCIQSDCDGVEILFGAEGGVYVGDADAKTARVHVMMVDSSFASLWLAGTRVCAIRQGRLERHTVVMMLPHDHPLVAIAAIKVSGNLSSARYEVYFLPLHSCHSNTSTTFSEKEEEEATHEGWREWWRRAVA